MFAFAGIKTGWDKRKEQRCLLVLCLLCWKTGWDKRKKQKMPVCLCLCTFIEIRRGTKNLDLVLCTVVYIGLGKTSVTIWTISSVENWGNHWGKWTILRSFQDHMGGPAWWHWGCNLTAYKGLLDYPKIFLNIFGSWLNCAKGKIGKRESTFYAFKFAFIKSQVFLLYINPRCIGFVVSVTLSNPTQTT